MAIGEPKSDDAVRGIRARSRAALASVLRAEAARRGLTVAQLGMLSSEAGGPSRGSVRRYWNGERDIAWVDLAVLCRVAQIDLVELTAAALEATGWAERTEGPTASGHRLNG